MAEVTPEDRLKMREIAEKSLADSNFEELCTNMVRSLAKRKTLTPQQNEAYVIAFFDVLMSKMLDSRNRLLDEIRRA